jgi:hypothetical protein
MGISSVFPNAKPLFFQTVSYLSDANHELPRGFNLELQYRLRGREKIWDSRQFYCIINALFSDFNAHGGLNVKISMFQHCLLKIKVYRLVVRKNTVWH